MRTTYRTGFPIATTDGQDCLAAAAATCLKWAVTRRGVETHYGPLANSTLGSIAPTHIGAGHRLEARLLAESGSRAWAMRLRHPHRDGKETDEQIEWRSEIGLSEKAGALTFYCSVSVGRSDSAVAPVRWMPSRPGVVLDILKQFACGGKVLLRETAYKLTDNAEDAQLFRALLESSSRQHPVVFITPRVSDGSFAANHESVTRELAGLAYVVVASCPEATRVLGEELPAQLNCWDGSVRVYWPGFTVSQSPFSHPLWLPWKVEQYNRKHPEAFAKELLKRISSVAVLSLDPDWLTWAGVESHERAQAIERAKALGDTEELLKLYVKDKEELEATVQQLRSQVQARAQELQVAQAKNAAYEAAFERMKQGEDAGVAEEVPPLNVAEAIRRAASKFGEKFIFAWNSKSETDGPFDDAEEVFQAFVWLATNYHDSKNGKRPGKPLKEDMRESMEGWFYSGGQNDAMMRDYKEWYQCQGPDGRKHWLGEHIGTGTSKDGRETIRIGFTWDKDSKKVVLGFIGQHQKNRAT